MGMSNKGKLAKGHGFCRAAPINGNYRDLRWSNWALVPREEEEVCRQLVSTPLAPDRSGERPSRACARSRSSVGTSGSSGVLSAFVQQQKRPRRE
jgi:hypothetical protein